MKKSFNNPPDLITPSWIKAAENCKIILSRLTEYGKIFDESIKYNFCDSFDFYIKDLFNAILASCANIPNSNTIFKQLFQELERFGVIVFGKSKFRDLLNKPNILWGTITTGYCNMIKNMLKIKEFSENDKHTILEGIKNKYGLEYPFNTVVLERISSSNKWHKNEHGNYYLK